MFNQCHYVALALVIVLNSASGHDHDRQHSHFCEGTGHTLFCVANQTLKIDKAWYGRVANDVSCVGDGSTPVDDNTTASHNLKEDCGASIMDSKSKWCKTTEKGDTTGCIIAVQDLAPEKEEKKCPEGVTKYLYLEYECLEGGGSGGGSGRARLGLGGLAVVVLVLLGFFF